MEGQIFAVITDVKRNGILLNKKNFVWKFYAVVWRHLFPLRGVLLRIRGIFQRRRMVYGSGKSNVFIDQQ